MSQKSKGILFIVLSAFFFALMNLFVKLSGDLPSMQKSFFRNLVALIFALIILLRSEEKFAFKRSNLPILFARSIFGTIGILCNYYAVTHLLLPDASMLGKLSPFFAILVSYLYLKEKVTPVQAGSVVVAFIGALFIIKPGFTAFTQFFPCIIGALGGLGAGTAYTMVRKLSLNGERGPFIVFFFSTFSCLVCLPYLLFFYTPMTPYQLAMLLCAGLAASGGQFSVTAAYSNAPARELSIYDYSQVIFAAIMELMFFHQLPDIWSVVGYVIICGISILMFFYNRRQPV